MQLLIMTGSKLRHLYFAIMMLRQFKDAKVLIEDFYEETGKNYTKKDVTDLMAKHFEEFDATERAYFKDIVCKQRALLDENIVARIKPGTINDAETIRLVRNLQPQAIAVHSTSIICEEFIQSFPKRIINLHAGLSPYYRGAGTNLFPFYNGELEFVGMTVHYLDIGIDSGDIILQGRPAFDNDDNPHTVGCKNVVLGTKLMIKVIDKMLHTDKALQSIKQNLTKGRLYLIKHFDDDVLISIKEKLKLGMVRKYIENPRKIKMVEW